MRRITALLVTAVAVLTTAVGTTAIGTAAAAGPYCGLRWGSTPENVATGSSG